VISTLIVADSGAVMRSVTATLRHLEDIEIVAYASGRNPVGAIVRSANPDLVLVDQMAWIGLALDRIKEVRQAAPTTIVVGLADRSDISWTVPGMRAGAASIVPRDLEPSTLGLVLREVLPPRTLTPRTGTMRLEGAA
jgi:DNA-binding NarL/FixJ family response regulator